MSDDIDANLPFRSEYAKSGRSTCKHCKSSIAQATLRLAIMVQSPMFDGKMANWYHPKCFFQRARPKAVGDIANFDSLRWEDQENVKKLMESSSGPVAAGKKGKGSKGEAEKNGSVMGDFRTEYAKSGGSKCGVCEEKIAKNAVRVGKKEYESTRAKMYGPYDKWHHVQCFKDQREQLEFYTSGEDLPGFNTLSADDKAMLKSELKAIPGKRKAEASSDGPDKKKAKDDPKMQEEIKKQNKKIYYYRDLLEKNLKKPELVDLLDANEQQVPKGNDKILDRLSDIMTFGALLPCSECKNGQFTFRSGSGYQCTGDLTEWTKCTNTVMEPKRKPFHVPDEFREAYDFLKLYKYKPSNRIIPFNPSTIKTNNGDATDGRSGGFASGKQPLRGLTFVLEGVEKKKLEEKIKNLGGKVSKDVDSKIAALVTTMEALEKKHKSKVIKAAMENKIQAVSEDIFDEASKEGILTCIRNKTISEWEANDPKTRIAIETKSSSQILKKDIPKSMKIKLKGGGFVDPDSKLEDKAHVLKVKENLLTAVLGAADVQSGRNSYYKLQVLEHDRKPKWWLFRSWGRVGTTIGGTKLDEFEERHAAIRSFEFYFEDKTGNSWSRRENFKKVVGKFYPLDIDYGEDQEKIQKLEVATSKSKLDKAIQQLITLIFDIEQMRKTLVEFEIDTEKMPLGKLSRKQIKNAYEILTETLSMIREDSGSKDKFIDATNRFFTLIPHDFGLNSPPILDNPDYVKTKLEMLDNLLEIEIAYNLLKSGADDSSMDPIDSHYQKLNCKIEVLDKQSEEFSIIEKYVKQTHAQTHNLYDLEIEDVFKVDRKGESSRYKPFKKLHNRMLLWHGSRTTNFAGILSKGLRIAPPEAPVTGYMFGKGIYFADMVSKSANYCQTSRTNNNGLLLLCEVALGNMYERFHADYIVKPPKGMHSTKGVGKTEPDPSEVAELDGAVVPVGKGKKTEKLAEKNIRSDLLYNEYIVYDVDQVKAKYLLKLKFNYKF